MKLRNKKLKNSVNFQVASMAYWIGHWADMQEVPGSRLTRGNKEITTVTKIFFARLFVKLIPKLWQVIDEFWAYFLV